MLFQTLVVALVHSRFDNCNSVLTGLPVIIQSIHSIYVQNAATRFIFRIGRYDHITDALINFHWLRVSERILFKIIAVLTY